MAKIVLFLYRRRSVVLAASVIVALAGARFGFGVGNHPPTFGLWDGPL